MRIRDHVILSSLGALALYPRLNKKVLVPWATSILLDGDHYVWFCIHERRLNPWEAMRFFGQAQPPHHRNTRRLHSIDVLLTLLALGYPWRGARLLLLGALFHVVLDVLHETRMSDARRNALRRDHYVCQWCGTQDGTIVAHLWRQPALLPSYRMEHFVSLCQACHEAAHKGFALDRPDFTLQEQQPASA